MRRPRLLGIFLLAAALMPTGAEFAVARSADEDDVSVPLEWRNQIIADLEHNKRYLPRIRTRGRSGIVRFEFNMSRSGWVLPGTRIVTINPELGRAALLLIQQSQPFSPPEHVKLPDASFRLVVPIRFENAPPREAGQDAERRKLVECYEADRQELEYQRRRAAYRHAEPPTTVNRMPEGCREAKQQEQERQHQQAEREEKEARAVLEERQRQEAKPKGLEYARKSGTTWRITRKKNQTTDGADVTSKKTKMAPLPPWKEFAGRERLSFSRRSSTRRERRRWISPIASTATVEFAPLIASMMKTRRKNLFRNINIPTDSSSSPSAATSKGWSGWI
jgi:hypothetical protein